MRHPKSRGQLCTVIMATVNPRRVLAYKIQTRLSDLSASQLLKVASSIDDGNLSGDFEDMSEPELYELIVDYIRSEKLKALEDGGMAQLLLLEDMLSDLVAMEMVTVGDVQTAPFEKEDPTTHQQGCFTQPHFNYGQLAIPPVSLTTLIPEHPLHMDSDLHGNASTVNRDLHTHPSHAGRDSLTPVRYPTISVPATSFTAGFGAAHPGRVSLSSSIGDQVLRLNDVASLLPCREFKLHGGQISDVGSEMSYSSLCKQIDEGLQEGITESEIIHTVVKITKPGTFREMLANKGDLTVDELKRFLHAHIRGKNSV